MAVIVAPVAGATAPGGATRELDTMKEQLAQQRKKLQEQKEALMRKKAAAAAGAGASQQPKAPDVLPSMAKLAAIGEGPVPLLLDDQGRQVDEKGNLVSSLASKANTNKSLLINKRLEREKVFGLNKTKDGAPVETVAVTSVDRRLNTQKATRGKRSFQFLEPGSIVRKADRKRAEVKMEQFNRELQESGKDVAELMQQNPDMALQMRIGLDTTGREHESIPGLEWWDAALMMLADGDDDGKDSSEEDGAKKMDTKDEEKIETYAQVCLVSATHFKCRFDAQRL